jgi:hypothetical protein
MFIFINNVVFRKKKHFREHPRKRKTTLNSMPYLDCIDHTDDPDFLSTVSKHFQNKFGEALTAPIKKSAQSLITSPDVSSTIERLGLTNPQVTMLTGSLAQANGEDFNNISLSVSTTRRHRMANRNNIDKKIRESFTVAENSVLLSIGTVRKRRTSLTSAIRI